MATRASSIAVARAIERNLAREGLPERRAWLSGGYAPSALHVLGVPVPALRRIVRQQATDLRHASADEVVAIALALVDGGTVEGRQAGYELLARRQDAMARLTPGLVRRLGTGNDNWASVDGFATFVAGAAWLRGTLTDADVDRWARSKDRWWRRTALVSTVVLNLPARGGHGDAERTLAVCAHFAAERDAMLAKALSWALRSLVRWAPDRVRAFLDEHAATLPAVVRREVSAKLTTGRKSQRRPAAQSASRTRTPTRDVSRPRR